MEDLEWLVVQCRLVARRTTQRSMVISAMLRALVAFR
jgi:hypothetical protein